MSELFQLSKKKIVIMHKKKENFKKKFKKRVTPRLSLRAFYALFGVKAIGVSVRNLCNGDGFSYT